MSGLSDHLKGVRPETPPADKDEPKPKVEKDIDDKDGKDRSWKEVRGEILRKQEKDKAELMGMMTTLSNQIGQMQVRPDPTPQPGTTGATQLEDMSMAELQSFRSTVDWEKISEPDKSRFELLVTKRQMEDKFDNRLDAFQKQQRHDAEASQYAQLAVSRYPDLQNPGSDLAREVDGRLKAMSEAAVAANPRAVLDVANEVAIDRNVSPQTRRTVQGLTKPAGTRTGPTETEPDEPANMSTDEQRKKLAARFKRALPVGVEFDLDEIKAEEAEIRRNIKDFEE